MTYETLMYAHLATVIPASILGLSIFLQQKGSHLHKMLGRMYVILMLITATITLFMPTRVGYKLFNHFGWLHIFCLVVFISTYRGYTAIKKGNIKVHQRSMTLLYAGAIILAGFFALMPGRYLHQIIFG